MATATKPAPAPKTRVERTPAEKSKNFHDAIPSRVDRVLKALRSLRMLAKPIKYTWTVDEHRKIWGAIGEAATACEAAFRNPSAKGKPEGFTL